MKTRKEYIVRMPEFVTPRHGFDAGVKYRIKAQFADGSFILVKENNETLERFNFWEIMPWSPNLKKIKDEIMVRA